ncbi:MAG: hypothetical protein QM373_00560 [Bacillota bacterium]|jgi:hypothetical protein|nr:hypothetical protein [Bacillota bacterium]
MRICRDCFTANPSYVSYCQKCSGQLTRSDVPYYSIRITKKRPRRVPIQLRSLRRA